MDHEIKSLLNSGCVSTLGHKPTVVNPLSVAKNRAGKKRMVFDCREINGGIAKYSIRFEDGYLFDKCFYQNCFLGNFDLRGAYHHIDIFESHKEYLGFKWRGQYYCFNVLPFGLSSAGYIFTLVAHWRSQGFQVLLYLVDGIFLADTHKNFTELALKIKSDLFACGFLIAEEKCQWQPTQVLYWLGFIWDSKDFAVQVSDSYFKVASATRKISESV